MIHARSQQIYRVFDAPQIFGSNTNFVIFGGLLKTKKKLESCVAVSG